MGKHKIVYFLWDGHKRDTKILDLIQSDVCGPINVKSLGGATYFVTFSDDASKNVWPFPIKSKDQVFWNFSEISYGYWKGN